MIEENFSLVKQEAERLGLKPETIISGVRLFKDKIFLIVDEIVEAQMEILSLTQQDVDSLTQLFTLAKVKQVQFYYIEISGSKKLKMRNLIKPVEKQEEKKKINKDFFDELTMNKSQYKNVNDFLDNLFGNKYK